MDKPLSLVIDDTKRDIINVINESQLTPILLRPIVKDIYEEINKMVEVELREERKQYEESLKAQEENITETEEGEN